MKKHKSKYAIKKRQKYAPGGMYESNTITAAQQGNGATESIVYEEANPQVLEAAKNAKLKNNETLAQNANTAATDINAAKDADLAAVETDAAEAKAKEQSIDATAGKAVKTITNDGKGGAIDKFKGDVKEAGQRIKETGMKLFQRKAIEASKKKAAASIAGEGFGNVARQKSSEAVSKALADQATHKGQEVLINQAQNKAMDYTAGFGADQASKFALDQGKDILIDKAKDVALNKGKDLVVDKAKDVVTKKVTEKVTETATKKAAELAAQKLGETAVKEGAKSAVGSSINPNPYATAANLAGTAISMGSDDGDATTWNAGEATGDILAKAGSYAGYGAMIGSVVPGVGNAVGAVVGGVIGAGVATWQGLTGRKKARKEKAAAEAKANEKAKEQNTKTTKSFTSQLSRTRAAEVEAKTYSGYDLGNNVSAKRGGFKAVPQYNKAS